MNINWPEKKLCSRTCFTSVSANEDCDCGANKWNSCLDACKKAVSEAKDYCKCKVPEIDHNDIRRIHGSKCVNCHKSINIVRPENKIEEKPSGLVELDEKEKCVCCGRSLDEQFKKTGINKNYKELKELPEIIEVGKKCGYCIVPYGSMTRDIDLLAVPWVEGAVTPKGLIRMICSVNPNKIFVEKHQKITEKPFERLSQVITLAGENTYIDLTICSTFATPKPRAVITVDDIYIELCLECGNEERGDLLNSKEKEIELKRYAQAIFNRLQEEG